MRVKAGIYKSKKNKMTRKSRLKVCNLNTLKTMDDIYDALQSAFALPSYFGRNLDALNDCLENDVKGPFKIIWTKHKASESLLGEPNYHGLIDIFVAVSQERNDFEFIFD